MTLTTIKILTQNQAILLPIIQKLSIIFLLVVFLITFSHLSSIKLSTPSTSLGGILHKMLMKLKKRSKIMKSNINTILILQHALPRQSMTTPTFTQLLQGFKLTLPVSQKSIMLSFMFNHGFDPNHLIKTLRIIDDSTYFIIFSRVFILFIFSFQHLFFQYLYFLLFTHTHTFLFNIFLCFMFVLLIYKKIKKL